MSILKKTAEFLNGWPPEAEGALDYDFTDGSREDCGIYAEEEKTVAAYLDGSKEIAADFGVFIRRFREEAGADGVEHLQALSEWVGKKAEEGVYPDLGAGRRTVYMACSNPAVVNPEETGTRSAYAVRLEINYIEGE